MIAGAAALRRRVRLAGRLLALPVTLTAPISAQRLLAVGSQAAAGFVLCTEPLTNERLCLLCHQRGGTEKNRRHELAASRGLLEKRVRRVPARSRQRAHQVARWVECAARVARVMELDPVASHASWMESFPWTWLADVVLPPEQKAPIDWAHVRQLNPHEARACLGAGNYAGMYQCSDEEMQDL